jgi:hypothetical protein
MATPRRSPRHIASATVRFIGVAILRVPIANAPAGFVLGASSALIAPAGLTDATNGVLGEGVNFSSIWAAPPAPLPPRVRGHLRLQHRRPKFASRLRTRRSSMRPPCADGAPTWAAPSISVNDCGVSSASTEILSGALVDPVEALAAARDSLPMHGKSRDAEASLSLRYLTPSPARPEWC